MKVLIQQAHINDPGSPHNGSRSDILIESGFIKDIQPAIKTKADTIINGNDIHVSPGWVDVFANFADPGQEHKETLKSGSEAAAAGGFTDVFVIPDTHPTIDTKSQVEYIRHKSASLDVNIYPIGAISKNTEGKDLAEMYDMRASGAIAFSDGMNPVQSAGVLVKALQYVKTFDGVIIQIPDDKSVGSNGLMHEGILSAQLGLSGKPMMAEELLVARDIKLARYAGSKIHFTGVSSPKSLEYIRRAKEAGLAVTCSVTPYHLFFTDSDIEQYNTNLKVYPPLRPANERDNLRKALADGTIDCIATHHLPHETDSKVVEFESAAYGMIGLETCYAALKTAVPEISESKWVELLSLNARKIFGLDYRVIQKDFPASVTIYQPSEHIEVNETFFRSRSRNSPFIGKQLKGKGVRNHKRGESIFNQLKLFFMATGKTNIGLMYGLICGGVSIVFTLVLYMGGVKWFVHPIAWSGLAFPIIVAVLGGLAQKKANGGFLTFAEGLKTTFTVFVIGSLVATAFQYVLFNIIDVPFREALAQETAEVTARMMEKFGASQENIDKATTEAMNGNNYSAGKMALSFAFGCILWFLFSLIIAAIIKKKKPEFDNTQFNK